MLILVLLSASAKGPYNDHAIFTKTQKEVTIDNFVYEYSTDLPEKITDKTNLKFNVTISFNESQTVETFRLTERALYLDDQEFNSSDSSYLPDVTIYAMNTDNLKMTNLSITFTLEFTITPQNTPFKGAVYLAPHLMVTIVTNKVSSGSSGIQVTWPPTLVTFEEPSSNKEGIPITWSPLLLAILVVPAGGKGIRKR